MSAEATFIPTRSVGWTAGFGNFFRKELGSWWGTRRWLVHLILWLIVVNGFVLLVALEPGNKNATIASKMAETLSVFVQVGGFFSTVGAIIVTQGAIVGERHSGTAAWLLTKPIARQSFVITKFLAILASFVTLSYLMPLGVLYLEYFLVFKTVPDAHRLLPAVGLILVNLTFYVAFTIMWGTLFGSRGAVNGVSIGFFISGNIIPNFVPKWLPLLTPWPLVPFAGQIAGGKSAPVSPWILVGVTGLWIVASLAIALWRFDREEM